jgi:hypothetical protein
MFLAAYGEMRVPRIHFYISSYIVGNVVSYGLIKITHKSVFACMIYLIDLNIMSAL